MITKRSLKKFSLILLAFTFFLFAVVLNTNAAVSKNTSVSDGIPSLLIGKYWCANIHSSSKVKHEYFYATRDGFVLKHTSNGTFTSKNINYVRMLDGFVLNGSDPLNASKRIWIFIKPNKTWTKIKIGYTQVPKNKEPEQFPGYYAKKTAFRVSKVTAILH